MLKHHMIDYNGQNKTENAYNLYMGGHKVDQDLISENLKKQKSQKVVLREF